LKPFLIGKIALVLALNHVISRFLKKTGAVSHGSDNGFSDGEFTDRPTVRRKARQNRFDSADDW
jgi:hypothetical protein